MRLSDKTVPHAVNKAPHAMIRGIRVDLSSLLELRHECRDGACQQEHCCCSTYEVCVTDRELRRIEGLLPFAAEFCPNLRTGDGFDNIFERLDRRLHGIDTTEDGRCLLAYLKNGSVKCSLHSAAGKIGLPPHKVKPLSCVLWPLTISSDRPPILSVDPNAYSFGCCVRRQTPSRMSPSIAQTLQALFGPLFMRDLEKVLDEVLKKAPD